MLRYYTLAERAHELAVGARALHDGPLIEVDAAEYVPELALKRSLLRQDHPYYFQAAPGSEPAQWETLAVVLADLCRQDPAHFRLAQDGDRWTWHNRRLDTVTTFRYGATDSLPYPPLDWAGRQVQEDLLLLDGSPPDFPLVAGQLCFANRWSLDEKMGLSFAAIHGPVPGFEAQIGRPANLLLERLRSDRPVWRYNWSLVPSPDLDLSTRAYADVLPLFASIDAANVGRRCFLRTERQTLSRLPQSGAILFTIHSYRTALDELTADPAWAQRFLGVVEQASPALLRYKGVTPIEGCLRAYLADRAQAS